MNDLREMRSSWLVICAVCGLLAFGVGLLAGMYVAITIARVVVM